jgi:Tol biopolymer transport system component
MVVGSSARMKPGLIVLRGTFRGSFGGGVWLHSVGLGLLLFIGALNGATALELLSLRESHLVAPSGGNGDSVSPELTPDGRFVLFSSAASDLVTNDNAWLYLDVFLHDRLQNKTTLISENGNRTGGGNGHSVGLGVSTNGRYVLFESEAGDLVSGDANGRNDVFVRDNATESTWLVSVALDGNSGNGMSDQAVMTPDGRYVAFVSAATNLVAQDTNGIPDVFVRDLQTQTTTLISVGATNANSGMGATVITPDGRWVAFFSTARGLVAGVSNISRGEIYLRDTVNQVTHWPSTNAIALVRAAMLFTSVPVPMHPVVSDDGRHVAFACGWTNNATPPPSGTTPATVLFQFDTLTASTTLISTNGYPPSPFGDEIYGPEMTPDGKTVVFAARVTNGISPYCALWAWDQTAGTNSIVSLSMTGLVVSNRTALAPVVTPDGRHVTFLSDATNLVNNPVVAGWHLYQRDRWTDVTRLIDADHHGEGTTEELHIDRFGVSADGRWVGYSAPDGVLVPEDDNGADDVFVRDMLGETNELISPREATMTARAGNASSLAGLVALSADGERAAFATHASDLIAGDTNGDADVFVWHRAGQSNELVSVGLDGLPARGGASVYPQISADGRYVLFVSGATNLVANDTNGLFDVFVRDLGLQVTTCISVMTNGTSLGAHEVPQVAMTPDARHVVILTRTNATGSTYPLFWRDRMSGETKLIAASASNLRDLSLSTNGQRVAYHNATGNLLVWDAGAGMAIYSTPGSIGSSRISPIGNRVLHQGAGQLVCRDLNAQSNLFSWPSTLRLASPAPWSPDERHVVFVTAAALVAADANGASDVYLCDLQTGTLHLISGNAAGTAAGSAASDGPMFSADGRFIAYRSMATNLLPAPTAAPGLFVFDRVTGSNQLLVAGSGVAGTAWFSAPVLSADGSIVAFQSVDSGLAPGDLNRTVDAFAGGVSVLALADGDEDGIADWWLEQYFGHADGQEEDLSRANDDADGDGMTNYEEFLAGTDPSDADSALTIQITTTAVSQTQVVLSWPAQAGKNYRVQFRDDVAAGDWQNLTTPVQVVGGQGWVTVTRTNDARVFRVRLEP